MQRASADTSVCTCRLALLTGPRRCMLLPAAASRTLCGCCWGLGQMRPLRTRCVSGTLSKECSSGTLSKLLYFAAPSVLTASVLLCTCISSSEHCPAWRDLPFVLCTHRLAWSFLQNRLGAFHPFSHALVSRRHRCCLLASMKGFARGYCISRLQHKRTFATSGSNQGSLSSAHDLHQVCGPFKLRSQGSRSRIGASQHDQTCPDCVSAVWSVQEGKTPADIAYAAGHHDISAQLIKAGTGGAQTSSQVTGGGQTWHLLIPTTAQLWQLSVQRYCHLFRRGDCCL